MAYDAAYHSAYYQANKAKLANRMKATASKEQLLVFAGNIQKLFGGFDAGQV